MILKKLKSDAEKYIGKKITDVVITVPAYFNDAQRRATIHAGQIAGFNVLNIINEPTAAALAYGLNKLDSHETVFVFDLGGGTFDVTIMRIENQNITMLATDGDGDLGGKDWDNVLVERIASGFKAAHGVDPRESPETAQDLQSRATQAKIQLSSRPRTTVVLNHCGKSHRLLITKEEYLNLCAHLVERCKNACQQVIQDAKMSWSDVDRILLIGGMTRMPMIRDMLSELTGLPLTDSVNPDEAVAIGAAVQGVLSLMRLEDQLGEKIVEETTREQFSSKEGGLIQITNIASHNIGVVLWDQQQQKEFIYPMIKKSTQLPCEITSTFGTSRSNMQKIAIRIVEGESEEPAECSALGMCRISLPLQLEKGAPVDVTYRYNTNQVLEVIAAACGQAAVVAIDRNSGLSTEELYRAKQNFSRIQVS